MPRYDSILSSLDEDLRERIDGLFRTIHFSEMEKLEIAKDEADLALWGERSFTTVPFERNRDDGRDGKRYLARLREYMSHLRDSETDYSSFTPSKLIRKKEKTTFSEYPLYITECPCPKDGEETRCCNLNTLDVIKQCAFNCSYCSVQSFYSDRSIEVRSNLREGLKSMALDKSVWHIGTGQASDSLLFNNRYGEIDALSDFSEEHKDIVIELKSKNERTFFDRPYPRNLIFTWSLNAPTIINKEEISTASLDRRLLSARKSADSHSLVGFHIHPMVFFKGWEDEYRAIADRIMSLFDPSEILMISFGTLTFTKSVLKRMREDQRPSKITEMPLSPIAGKYSYPLEIKERLFKTMYSFFSDEFHKGVFFYLCLEDPVLWERCLNRSYPTNKAFEEDMRKSYFEKINSL